MQEHERLTIAGMGGVLLLTWLGFFVHRSPRFPGSIVGSAFGVAGAILMLLPLVYTVAKRVPILRARITRRVSMHTLLAVHVYGGIAGALFAVIHTGHKFDSSLGIALTATLLLVVSSGVAVRYLLPYVTHEIAAKVSLLQTARGDLDHAWGMLELSSVETQGLPRARTLAAALASMGFGRQSASAARDVVLLAEGVADLEYAVRTHELLKRWFHRMLAAHIILSVAFYLLLGAHLWSAVYFGIRWLG